MLGNGTFLNAGLTPETSLVPSLGYDESGELTSDRDRKEFGLAPKPRMHDLADAAQGMHNALSRDADFIDYRAHFCTAADQLPVTSGYIEKDTVENGRRCIDYRMDAKMADIYSFVSARYEIRRDAWHGPPGDVAIEIDSQRGHAYNRDRMGAGAAEGRRDILEAQCLKAGLGRIAREQLSAVAGDGGLAIRVQRRRDHE